MTKQHTETRPGEMFLSNETKSYYNNNINYESQRMGLIAYDINGEIITDLHPVFVQTAEYNEVQDAYKHRKF